MEVFLLNGESVEESVLKYLSDSEIQRIIKFITRDRYASKYPRGGLIKIG